MKTLTARLFAGVAVLAAGPLLPGAEAAGAPRQFALVARADVAGVEVLYRGAPLVPGGRLVFFSPATAQTELSAVTSRGYASAPYPGAFALSLPGTVSGASSGAADIPNYPLFVESDASFTPSPEPVSYGPFLLTASSSDQRSVATATMAGSTADGVTLEGAAKSLAAVKDGDLITESTATVAGLALGDAVVIGESKSFARVKTPAGRPPVFESGLDPAAITVAGKTFGLHGDRLVAADASTPTDASLAEKFLAEQGIDLRYVKAQRTPTSITGAMLQVTFPFAVPGQSTGSVTLSLGHVSASVVDVSAAPAFSGEPTRWTGVLGEAGDNTEGAGGFPAGDSASTRRLERVTELGASETVGATRTGRRRPDPSAQGIYLVIAATALLSLAGSRLINAVGIARRFVRGAAS